MTQPSAPSPRAVIFDADGVLVRPPQLFSRRYCAERGWSPDHLDPFFAGEFQQALCGQADIMELLLASPLWDYHGDPRMLLDHWLESEYHLDPSLINLSRRLRAAGMPVFLATNQERYRGNYFREVMFPNFFDEYFISNEMGCLKNADQFWLQLKTTLAVQFPHINPTQMIFFDDSPDHIEAAHRAGIQASLYQDPGQVTSALALPVLE